MTSFVVILLGWLLLFGWIAAYETFTLGYKSPLDWWRNEIARKKRR